MFASIDHFFRRWRRRFSRSEWAIKVLGLPVSEDTANEPGLVLIQIDGLSRRQMERALERDRLPFLRKLIRREQYETRTFYPGMPSSTPAVQAELFYDICCGVPAFSFFDRELKRAVSMLTPQCVAEIEETFRSKGNGLLAGGSSWSNIYCGGATDTETHFCSAALRMKDLFRSRPLIRLLTFPLVHFPSLFKIVALLVIETFIALWHMIRGIVHGESPFEECKIMLKRVFVCIGLRELLSIGVKIDTARGLPIIHVNFLGYDEQSHRRGPSSAFAHWSLRGIDRAIKGIYRAAQRSARRDYQVWIFSDHGHESTTFFDAAGNRGLEQIIEEALGAVQPQRRKDGSARAHLTSGRTGGLGGMWEQFSTDVTSLYEERPFTIAALGPLGHLYLKERVNADRKIEVAERLVKSGVPGVLVALGSGQAAWVHARGIVRLPEEPLDFLPQSDALKRELVHDLIYLCESKFAGDLILVGWGAEGAIYSFVNERGAHAGPGPEETQGFVLLPAQTRLPDRVNEFLRPADLRAAVLNYLQREPLPRVEPRTRALKEPLRVMTYNVHSCLGMDGRISPRRIARVIECYRPDLVALQELDLGRVRSQRHDQPKLIAEELGMQLAFCPTVVAQGEQYGHALLSRYPIKVIRTELLSSGIFMRHVEPRGALWVQVEIDGVVVNLMNTHFGLRRRERVLQAAHLLNGDWIGSIPEEEPLILCGDFNMLPRSEPYRALTRRLRDVQSDVTISPPLNTFTTIQPFARIDHIFVSRHFLPTNISAPRNQLTRVASDHLPLVVDLTCSFSASTSVEEVSASAEAASSSSEVWNPLRAESRRMT